MKDPRLAEIEFLMDLDREEGTLEVRAQLDGYGSGAGRDRKFYGLDSVRFRDMVIGLLLQNYLTSAIGRSTSAYDELAVDRERARLFQRIAEGQPASVYITYAGRIHLWNQRDALLRDPDLEPFGLRSRAAWERDLFLRLQWATQQEPLSLMFLDLDNFGRVNKEHGAPVGDAVLRLVFGLVKSAVGTRGAAYRYGGEEVGVLLPGVDRATAAGLAEQLRALIERDVHPQVPQLGAPQTASIGVAAFTGPMENDAAVARVDELMRQAKRAGRNRVVVEDGGATAAAPAGPPT